MKSIKSMARVLVATAIPAIALCACSDNDDQPVKPGESDDEINGKFVFAASIQNSSTSYDLVTGTSLDEGFISTKDNGLLNPGATQWVFYKNYLYALTYNQGNAGTTRSYYLGTDGEMKARDIEYRISRFSSYGAYNDDIITMSTGDGPATLADSQGFLPKTLLVTYLNVVNETSRSNDTSTGAYSMENFLGNGEYVTLAGAEQSGSKLYCGAVPMGLSQYGVAYENRKWVRPDLNIWYMTKPEAPAQVHTRPASSWAPSIPTSAG